MAMIANTLTHMGVLWVSEGDTSPSLSIFLSRWSITFFIESSPLSGAKRAHLRPGQDPRLDLVALTATPSLIFTSVPVSSMLEEATAVKKQNYPFCRISDTREKPGGKDV